MIHPLRRSTPEQPVQAQIVGSIRPVSSPTLTRSVASAILFLLLATSGMAATFRYANSSNRIYVEGGGTATLSDIKAALPNCPLDLVDPVGKVWFLRANLVVEDGCILNLHGDAAGGDVNELRLLSRNSSAPNSIAIVDADWGTLNLHSVKVTSWDDAIGGPDTEHATYQRAYLRARSRSTGSGPVESTLNITDSEIAYLGYNFREGYALTWQVVGSVTGVNVYGAVSNSVIHHSEVDLSSWSSTTVTWSNNQINDSIVFAFQPNNPVHQALNAVNPFTNVEFGATFRWVTSNKRLYITGPGTATLSDIFSAVPEAPLVLVNEASRIWLLRCDVEINEGAILKLHGSAIGGDVDELRILSNNTAGSRSFVWISADYGTIDIRNTKVLSWNEVAGTPDTEYSTFGRAFIRVRSKLSGDGVTPLESRMDIIDSDVGYLGYNGSEAYGLVWKVIGTHPDPTKDIFDFVEVRGDILNSKLHHNYYGNYTYGHYGGQWVGNEVYSNVGYGFDPHDDSDHLLIANNLVYGNGNHGIIASKRCDHVTIRSNLVWGNAKNGIMLHRSCNDSVIEGNITHSNGDSGIALFATWRVLVQSNIVVSNSNSGIRFSVGSGDTTVIHNQIGYSGRNGGIYFYQGTDPAEPGQDSRPGDILIASNIIHNITGDSIKQQDSDNVTYYANEFQVDAPLLRFVNSTGTLVVSNVMATNSITRVVGSLAIPTQVRFVGQAAMEVNLNLATALFEDPAGAIYNIDESAGFTTAANALTGTPSSILLDVNLTGSFTHLYRFPLYVAAQETPLLVNPTVWGHLPTDIKTWTFNSATGTSPIDFRVETLTPEGAYDLLFNGVSQGTQTADLNGSVAFQLTPGTPGLKELKLVPLP